MKVGELSAHIRLDGKPEFDRGVDDAGRRFQGLGKTTQGVAKGLATGLIVATGTMAGLGAAAFKTGIEYNALQQSSRAALETLLGSAEAANAQMDKLDEFARTSPFAKDVFIQAQQQMIGFGIEAENVIPILSAVQDATAAVGGSNQDISDIVTTLSKISSTGKITAQDLNELGNKGIDAAGLIGAEFGKTSGEIREMITKGQISADDAIGAITTQMSVKFGGAAANVKETWVGAVDRIKAAWRDTGSALAAPFVDPQGGGKAIAWANDFADVLRAVQKQVEPLMGVVMARWGPDLDKITPYLQGLKDRIDDLDMSALNKSLDALDGYGPIIAGLSGAFAAWGTAALPIIGGINPIVAGVTALVMATPELRDEMGGVLAATAPLLPIMSDLGREVADLGMKVLKEVAPAFIELATSVVEAAVPLAGPFAGAVSGLLQIAEPLIDVLADVVGWMADLPDEVLLAGTAFMMLKGHSGALRDGFETLAIRGMLVGDSLRSMKLGGVAGSMSALATMTGKAGAALKTAFIANAPALAIAGIVTVIGKIAGASAAAEDRIKALADSFEYVGDTSERVRQQIYENLLADENYFGLGDNLVDRFTDAGIEISKVIDAILGDAEAFNEVTAELERLAQAAEAAGDPRMAAQYRDMADAMVKQQENVGAATDEYIRYQDAVGDTSDTEKAIVANERLTEILSGQTQAIESLIDARRREQGEAATYADAQVKHASAVETMQRAIEDESIALDKSTGKWDAYTRAGQTAIQGSKDTRDSMLDMAEALAQTADSVDDILPSLNDMHEGWIDQTMALGATREEAEALAAEYGLFPEQIATEAYLDANKAELDLDELLIKIEEVEGEPATVTIDGNSAPLEATLGEVVGDVDESSGTVDINGNRIPADMTVDELLRYIDASEEDVTINADSTLGQRELKSLAREVRETEESVIINANNVPAQNMRLRTQSDINNTWGYINIGALTSAFDSWLRRINGRTVGTAYVQVGAVGSGVAMLQADGAVVEYYANGGVRENHVAQIAPKGTIRIWNEDETEGEAYIPLAVSKRSRSVQILDEVADRFDLMVVPKNATAFVDGGMNGVPSGGGRSSAPAQVGRTVILRVGDREFPAYMEELADGRIASNPGVRAANGLVNNMSRYRAQMGV